MYVYIYVCMCVYVSMCVCNYVLFFIISKFHYLFKC